jgi:multidrug resistance efflux pump
LPPKSAASRTNAAARLGRATNSARCSAKREPRWRSPKREAERIARLRARGLVSEQEHARARSEVEQRRAASEAAASALARIDQEQKTRGKRPARQDPAAARDAVAFAGRRDDVRGRGEEL